ncbi:hypothetical protein GHT06_022782 [Daphnia sinensis]|uniref:Uncharacterized protein n=1 Tax=Daphnia sinensis TaxID=1820382 RepID=A0AAD5KYE0_9CRUS|nr:hypothetical protein GHT06_022782 [Daphnia sinensis]
MITLVLFSLFMGIGMAAPLYPETIDTAEPFPSVLKTAEHQFEDRNSRQIADIAFRLFSLKLIYSVVVAFAGIATKYQIACILASASCAPDYSPNGNINLLSDANLKNLADRHPNLFSQALDPEQQIYLKFFDPNFPAAVKNDVYLGNPTAPFIMATRNLENDEFALAMYHNLMGNIGLQPVNSSLNFLNRISGDRRQNIP